MSFSEIATQPVVQQLLLNSLIKNQLAHLYIFHGPSGSGRLQTAMHLSKAIFCEQQNHQYCNQCRECRKIDSHNHPLVQVIEPDGSSFKIDQMREIKKNFAYRAASSQPRIYIFREAEKMTIQAANSLLNFLEEPRAQLLAILITENRQALLPTIQSRSQSISFTPMSREHLIEVLLAEGIPEQLLRPAVHVTAGIESARTLVQSKWFAEMRNAVLQLVKESSNHFALSSITFQNKVMKTELAEQIPTLIDLFILWFKDMIQHHMHRTTHLVFFDQVEWMAPLARRRSLTYWLYMMGQAIEIKKRLRFNANTQVNIEKMLLKLQEGSN